MDDEVEHGRPVVSPQLAGGVGVLVGVAVVERKDYRASGQIGLPRPVVPHLLHRHRVIAMVVQVPVLARELGRADVHEVVARQIPLRVVVDEDRHRRVARPRARRRSRLRRGGRAIRAPGGRREQGDRTRRAQAARARAPRIAARDAFGRTDPCPHASTRRRAAAFHLTKTRRRVIPQESDPIAFVLGMCTMSRIGTRSRCEDFLGRGDGPRTPLQAEVGAGHRLRGRS